ncbi:DUF1294 domain-containing protein [Pseudobutyrivibrio ruminis]|uniref:Uncharacterized membrane protein YsdA, DUF1294 family n=1 Tax=Pseudobutyrivibrio ruminis DSM 9787 TaxID=1123011 RepID=A0A285SPN0_9FIRM|nr:DUF1294 domain-containing protein [Pseudobutyrivibrio ruminis]SOC10195.1 Uncharacterized membrane protein YsdA, DUF1294 family [Pseudobutyrivibrio ruminis DSM 9787]
MDKLILGYLVIANIAGLAVMGIDKAKAIKGAWRIPEKTLFLFSLIGGSIGTWAGMYLFHHKTKHWYFVIGMPAILIIQLVIAAYFMGLI